MIEALEMTHLPPSGSIEAKCGRMDNSDFIDGPTFVTIRTPDAVSEVDGAEQASESPTVVLWPGRVQLAAICYCFFLIGWSDGTNGPLIPRIQDFYHVLDLNIVSCFRISNNPPHRCHTLWFPSFS